MTNLLSYISGIIWAVLCKFINVQDRSIGICTYPDYDDTLRSIVANSFDYPDYKFYIFINNKVMPCDWIPKDNFRVIKKNTLKGVYFYHKCRFIFYTHNLFSSYKKCNKKIVINLWHGLPIKKVGLLNGDKFEKISNFDFLIADNKQYAKILQHVFGVGEDKILLSEHPRIDQIYSADKHSKFNHTVLWLPTFRSSREENLFKNHTLLSEMNRILRSKKTECIIKLHPLEFSPIENHRYSNIEILSNEDFNKKYESLYRMLGKIKFIITDISSVYFDCLNNNINSILFCRDIEQYKSNRGFISEAMQIVTGEIISEDHLFLSALSNKLDSHKPEICEPKYVTKKLLKIII